MLTALKRRISGKSAKVATVAVLSTLAIGLSAPMASASYESTWHHGCRGYWYTTSGHAYCKGVTSTSGYYDVHYYCSSFESDGYGFRSLPMGYVGKFHSYECIFSINSTKVVG